MRKREAPKRTFTLDSIQVSTYRSRADFRTRLLFASRSRVDCRTRLLVASRSRVDFRTRLARCIQVSSIFSHLLGSLHPGLDSRPHFALSRSPVASQVSTAPSHSPRSRLSRPQHFALAARSLAAHPGLENSGTNMFALLLRQNIRAVCGE